MKFNEISVGQSFITNLLPVDIANKCGIVCIEKQQNPNKVIVKRMTSDEQWAIFADKISDECNMGNWIKKE
jgi:spore cortex formation protein SpoVR/YcgB (stage V sporulation)